MKSYKPLQDAFRKLDQSTVSWFKSSRFPKTMETANTVLYRNAIVDGATLAYMAHCLGLSNKAIVGALEQYAVEVPKKAAEVAILKKLIAPVDITETEQKVISQMRNLDDAKRQLVVDMIAGLSK
jgi:hypothetical protein